MRPAVLLLAVAVAVPAPAQNSGPTPTGISAKGGTAAVPAPFVATPVAKFDSPWALAFLPDGRMLVTEKGGTIRLVTPAGRVSAPLAGVPPVRAGGQGGLLDIKLSPGFPRDGLVYITYAEPGAGGSALALARGRFTGSGFDRMTVLWREAPPGQGGQFGAVVTFAPDGGSLFLTSGERMRKTPAQDPASALGKILRLTLDGKPWPGNPSRGGARAARADVWTSGHRNPYGLAFAPDGRLWEVEMGPQGGDELNLIEPGRDYGWPVVSNGDDYDGTPIPDHPTRPEFAAPRLWWNPVISPSSLIFYTGALFPAWRGSALIGGLSSMALIRVAIDSAGRAREAERYDMNTRIRDVVQGPDGAVWLLEDGGRGAGGRLWKLTPKR